MAARASATTATTKARCAVETGRGERVGEPRMTLPSTISAAPGPKKRQESTKKAPRRRQESRDAASAVSAELGVPLRVSSPSLVDTADTRDSHGDDPLRRSWDAPPSPDRLAREADGPHR